MPAVAGARRTAQAMWAYALGTVAVSLVPVMVGDLGLLYLAVALAAGGLVRPRLPPPPAPSGGGHRPEGVPGLPRLPGGVVRGHRARRRSVLNHGFSGAAGGQGPALPSPGRRPAPGHRGGARRGAAPGCRARPPARHPSDHVRSHLEKLLEAGMLEEEAGLPAGRGRPPSATGSASPCWPATLRSASSSGASSRSCAGSPVTAGPARPRRRGPGEVGSSGNRPVSPSIEQTVREVVELLERLSFDPAPPVRRNGHAGRRRPPLPAPRRPLRSRRRHRLRLPRGIHARAGRIHVGATSRRSIAAVRRTGPLPGPAASAGIQEPKTSS